MTEAGLAKVDLVMLGEEARANRARATPTFPLRQTAPCWPNAKAWENFRNLTQRPVAGITLRLDHGRQEEETRKRRFARKPSRAWSRATGESRMISLDSSKQALMAKPEGLGELPQPRAVYREALTLGGSMHASEGGDGRAAAAAKPSRSWSKTKNSALK